MTNTIYIHQPEKSVSFTRLPNFLFEAPTFTALSNEAKLLYAFILRRTELSRKNDWADKYWRIFLYYPICEVVALLHYGRQKAVLRFERHKGKSPKEIQAYFQRAADFLIDRAGRENVVSAVVHMDEKTPHLHLTFVPLTKDNRLCAKEIIGNRANLTKWQDDFHAYIVEKYPDLERGDSASKTGRKRIPTRLFKQAVSHSKQARMIEATLDSISPLNAGKKKEDALAMLKKWFPQMENFDRQLKKYKVTINDLLEENQKLEVSARASESGKMKDRMERAKPESELQNIQRLVDHIPPDVLAEVKRQQRHTKER